MPWLRELSRAVEVVPHGPDAGTEQVQQEKKGVSKLSKRLEKLEKSKIKPIERKRRA